MKSYHNKTNTNFHANKTPKNGSDCVCLIDFLFKIGKNYYPQTLLEESTYNVQEEKINTFIIDEKEVSSSDDDDDLEGSSE